MNKVWLTSAQAPIWNKTLFDVILLYSKGTNSMFLHFKNHLETSIIPCTQRPFTQSGSLHWSQLDRLDFSNRIVPLQRRGWKLEHHWTVLTTTKCARKICRTLEWTYGRKSRCISMRIVKHTHWHIDGIVSLSHCIIASFLFIFTHFEGTLNYAVGLIATKSPRPPETASPLEGNVWD